LEINLENDPHLTVEPLVSAEVDLRSFPRMLIDATNLRDLAIDATAEEFRAAVVLMSAAWHQRPAASLPDSDIILAKIVGKTPRWWKQIRDNVLRDWVKCSDGRLYHPDLAEAAKSAWAKRKPKAVAASVSASVEAMTSSQPIENVQPVSAIEYNRIEDKKESNTNERESSASLRSSSPPPVSVSRGKAEKRPRKTKTSIDDAIEARLLDQKKMVEDASKLGVYREEIQAEYAKFRDYHLSAGTESADWAAKWRSWCSKIGQFDWRN
jgi:hypothetical protein